MHGFIPQILSMKIIGKIDKASQNHQECLNKVRDRLRAKLMRLNQVRSERNATLINNKEV